MVTFFHLLPCYELVTTVGRMEGAKVFWLPKAKAIFSKETADICGKERKFAYLLGAAGFMPTQWVFKGRCHCCLICAH